MKKITKILLSIMFMAIICLLVPSNANAEIITKHTWNGFVYTKHDVAWKDGDIRILSYRGKEKNLTIPSEIKGYKVAYVDSLGKSKCLESVHISDDVEIRGGALSECPNLKKITISKTNPDYIIKNKMLLSKDGKTLVNCPGGIKYPKIPDSVTVIGDYAFSGSTLKKISLGKNITHLGRYSFKNCKKLTGINFHKNIGVKYINAFTFENCKSLASIEIPDSVIWIDNETFQGCTNLETVITGRNLTYLGFFNKCPNLRFVYFYNKNCKIEEKESGAEFLINKYSQCADKVTLYGFENSTAVEGAKKFGINYEIIEERTCHNAQRSGDFEYTISSTQNGNTATITSYTGTEASVTIPAMIDGIPVKKIESLGESAYLQELYISDGITVKEGVLSICPNLKKVRVSDTNTKYCVKNKMLLSKDGKTLIACPGGLTTPKIPSSVTKIADEAFMGSAVTKITLGKNISVMGQRIFKNCQKLSSVKFHKNIKVKTIKHSVFENCDLLETIELPDSVERMHNFVFYDCKKLKTVTIGKNLKYMGRDVFSDCQSLRSLYVYSMKCTMGKRDYNWNGRTPIVYGLEGSAIQQQCNESYNMKFKIIEKMK